MKHTVCFIDDKIPVSQFDKYFKDTDIINESVLAFLKKIFKETKIAISFAKILIIYLTN